MEENLIISKIEKVILVGGEEYREETSKFINNRPYQELTFFLSGRTTVYFNDQVLKTEKNKISYLPDGAQKKYIVERNEKGDCIIIYFKANTLLDENAFVINAKNENCATLFKKIFSVWVKKDKGYYFECLSLLYKILSEMQKTRYITETHFKKIQPAVDYIEKNFLNETISSKKLSELCGISYSYIKKIFAIKYKTSPKKFCLLLKMNYACDLLSSGKYNISQTAEMCGYSDVYFFSHQFKLHVGVSPANFIKNYKSSK